ncbi:hypothetical protein GCM10020256_40430 [Streptomyces thermocoprophilus]
MHGQFPYGPLPEPGGQGELLVRQPGDGRPDMPELGLDGGADLDGVVGAGALLLRRGACERAYDLTGGPEGGRVSVVGGTAVGALWPYGDEPGAYAGGQEASPGR